MNNPTTSRVPADDSMCVIEVGGVYWMMPTAEAVAALVAFTHATPLDRDWAADSYKIRTTNTQRANITLRALTPLDVAAIHLNSEN